MEDPQKPGRSQASQCGLDDRSIQAGSGSAPLTAHAVTEYPTENGPAVIRFRSLSRPALFACDRDCPLGRSVSLAPVMGADSCASSVKS